MRKLISLLVAVVLVMSLATVAFATETTEGDAASTAVDTTGWTSAADTQTYKLNKIYTVTGANGDTIIVPQETLEFKVEALTTGAPEITVASVQYTDLTKGADGVIGAEMAISLPSYTAVGIYKYKVTETSGNAKAVTYAKEEVTFSVLVTYDYENECLNAELILTTGEKENKLDTFENTYDLGHMSVTKTVSGNLADKSVEFEMTVTLTSDKPVMSDITVVDGNASTGTTATITVADWELTDNGYTATANIKVSDGETVNLYNIPNGVTYVVEENAKHLIPEGETFDENSASDTHYKVDYTNESNDIVTNTTEAVSVKNTKETNVATGVITDSAPYIILIAVCAVAAVLFVTKRRAVEF